LKSAYAILVQASPADEIAHLTERFFRATPGKAEGSGLGLAIGRRIADLHGARLSLANAATGGFIARLLWPAAADKPRA
jgi:two-component system sensor histidine kinase QseC